MERFVDVLVTAIILGLPYETYGGVLLSLLTLGRILVNCKEDFA